jgi:hypothetical protein
MKKIRCITIYEDGRVTNRPPISCVGLALIGTGLTVWFFIAAIVEIVVSVAK